MKFDDFTLLIPVLISFLISVVLCPILIPFLRKLKFGQTVRDEGPASHLTFYDAGIWNHRFSG